MNISQSKPVDSAVASIPPVALPAPASQAILRDRVVDSLSPLPEMQQSVVATGNPHATNDDPAAAAFKTLSPAEQTAGTVNADAVYWPASELDIVARPVDQLELVDPTPAGMPHILGMVKLTVFIDENGGVDRVEITGKNVTTTLAEAIKSQFAGVRFFPAERHNRKVKSFKVVQVCLGECLTPEEVAKMVPHLAK